MLISISIESRMPPKIKTKTKKVPIASTSTSTVPSNEKLSTQLDRILADQSLSVVGCSAREDRPSKSGSKSGSKSKSSCSSSMDSRQKRMYGDLYEKETTVVELKMKDFEYDPKNKILRCKNELFTRMKRGIIIFYAPWCPHCNKIYDDIVELSINYMNIFPIGVVNVEDAKNKNKLLTNYAEVSKYPMMKIVDSEMIVRNYNNEITRDNLMYYINMNL